VTYTFKPKLLILRRLVTLNAKRLALSGVEGAREEKRGLIRWLRPEIQNPTRNPPDRAPSASQICGCEIYLRWRNLWPLALSHVILGALVYYVVVRRDPLAEIAAAVGALPNHG